MPAPPLQSEPAMVRTEGDCTGFSNDIGEQSCGFIDLISYPNLRECMTQGSKQMHRTQRHRLHGRRLNAI